MVALELRTERHGAFVQQVLEIDIVLFRMRRVSAHEESWPVMGDPVRERAASGIERIEQHQAAHTRARAAAIEDSQRRAVASAVGDNDNWHGPERPRRGWIPLHLGE